MPRNTPDEIIRFAKLTFQMVTPAEVQDELDLAADTVEFLAPAEDTPRSDRAEPLRKRAECLLASAGLFRKLAQWQLQSFPQKELIGTPGLQTGTDYPTAQEYYQAYLRIAEAWEVQAEKLLAKIQPVTSTIVAV